MGLAGSLEKLPGAFVLMPQQLTALPAEVCRSRLAAEGISSANLTDDEVRTQLEAAIGRRYCARFLPAVVLGLMAWAVAAAALPSEGGALGMLALPGPAILLWGSVVKK
mmetsp:Transcript_56657/g.156814  ORF Transcript_56657/g.156814 Transcript_56657/m.156814 type:complete len:109 (+) Transcript_56657:73-399(+)